MNTRVHHKLKVGPSDPTVLVDFLALRSGISKSRLKVVLTRGGVWIVGKKKRRIRRATQMIQPGEVYEVYDDPKLESADTSGVFALENGKEFSVWYKPAGVFSQGTPYGDEGSLLRLLEKEKKEVFLIHRLDRETAGLMVFGHNKKAAALLGKQFAANQITKIYQAEVKGHVAQSVGIIDRPLDGKEAVTHYQVHQKLESSTLLQIELETGRLHQIRRHLEAIGHPVLGDPKYGRANKDPRGLRLIASELHLPWNFKEPRIYQIPKELRFF